jgi:hypothetical protein
MPTPRTVAQIKANLLRPALTSHFEVKIPLPNGKNFDTYLKENGVSWVLQNQDRLNLLCSEASLPGSSLSTYDIVDDYTGVSEKHVYRRLYDDRIDFSFYVDAENYLPIRFFESWIKYIVNETIATKNNETPGSKDPNFFYRMRYPNDYIANSGLEITKFERDNKSSLVYNFVNVFPIAITSMPISYDTASLLKCSVSFSYIRYILNPSGSGAFRTGDDEKSSNKSAFGDPALEAAYNRLNNPLEGNGFGDPKVEAGAKAALGGATPGYANPNLEKGYQALYGTQEEININTFK